MKSAVSQGSPLGSVVYLLYTADLSITVNSMIAAFLDATVLLVIHEDLAQATYFLKNNLNKIQS